MTLEYKTVSLRTAKGIKTAERLKAQGWQQGSVGFETIQFYRNTSTENTSPKRSAHLETNIKAIRADLYLTRHKKEWEVACTGRNENREPYTVCIRKNLVEVEEAISGIQIEPNGNVVCL
jgi:hypothetical protein